MRLIDGVIAEVLSRKLRAVRSSAGVRSVVVDHAFKTRSDDDDADALMGDWPGRRRHAGRRHHARRGPPHDRRDRARHQRRGRRRRADRLGYHAGRGPRRPGQVVNGPDFSFDRRNPELTHLDAFGHGTHLAGIIAGVAPGARLVNVKAANAEGVTSLTQLLLAIDYTVRNRRANGLDIRVITLAVGADNDEGYERAAGARGRAPGGRHRGRRGGRQRRQLRQGPRAPAADPFVLAVGGADTKGTADLSDDEVADWSSRGDGTRNPDVIAPGSSIVSFRVPGSFIDQSSEGRIGDDRQRGSGTSQAAAVATGAAALLFENHKHRSPNQLKAALRETARPMAGDPRATGEGALDVAAAANATWPTPPAVPPRPPVRRLQQRPSLLRGRPPSAGLPRPPLDRPPLDGREVERREVERREVVTPDAGGSWGGAAGRAPPPRTVQCGH